MSTSFTADSRVRHPYVAPTGYPQAAAYGPWLGDVQHSNALRKRTLVTAAIAALTAGAAVGLVAFTLEGESPQPSGSTVQIPEYDVAPVAPQTVPTPNVAVPPSNSGREPVIVNVPPLTRSGSQINPPAAKPTPVPASAPPAPPPQAPVPRQVPLPLPFPLPNDQDPAPKQDPDPKPQDPAPKQDPAPAPKTEPQPQEPVPPRYEPAPKFPSDIYTIPKGSDASTGQLPEPDLPCLPGVPC